METRMYVFIAFVVIVALRVILRCYEDWRNEETYTVEEIVINFIRKTLAHSILVCIIYFIFL